MDILNPDRSFRIGAEITGGATLYGIFPRPSDERQTENEILKRLEGRRPADYSENPDIPVRTRMCCELNTAISGASDPDLLVKIGDWEDYEDVKRLIAIYNEFIRLKKIFIDQLDDWEKKGNDPLKLLHQEALVLDLWIFHRTGQLPGNQPLADLYPAQKRFLFLLITFLDETQWRNVKDRALNILRLKSVESSAPLDLLPPGMAYRLEALQINALRQAQARRIKMIEQIKRELRDDAG